MYSSENKELAEGLSGHMLIFSVYVLDTLRSVLAPSSLLESKKRK